MGADSFVADNDADGADFQDAAIEILALIEAQPPAARPRLLATVVINAMLQYGDTPLTELRWFNAHTETVLTDLRGPDGEAGKPIANRPLVVPPPRAARHKPAGRPSVR